MIMTVPPEIAVHRIGGASIENLRLNERDRTAIPPGLSVLLGGSALDASEQMRRVFGSSKKWKRLADRVASSTALEIASAGFLVIEATTHSLPNHGRIVHSLGLEAFDEVGLSKLAVVFRGTEEES